MSSIELNGVSLKYPIYDSVRGLLTRSLHKVIPVGGKIQKDQGERASVLALDNISVKIESGDRIALLGHNGAGKTSLLKLLSGFYEPTSGTVLMDGKVSALLSLMTGMDEQLNGYENIVLCGMLHGLSKKEIQARADEIAEFSELGSYLYLPVRLYSQGMISRLAFSICTAIDCDILLLDEWIGAGDQTFIEKAKERLSAMVARSSILIFATHNVEVAQRLCNKAMFLEHGKLRMFGSVEEVLAQYDQLSG